MCALSVGVLCINVPCISGCTKPCGWKRLITLLPPQPRVHPPRAGGVLTTAFSPGLRGPRGRRDTYDPSRACAATGSGSLRSARARTQRSAKVGRWRQMVVRTIAEDVPARRLHLFLRRLEAARTRELLLHLLIYRPRVAFRGARLPADHAERVVLVQCLRQGNPPWVRAHGRAALSSVADSPGRWCATPPRPTCAETPP